MPCSKIPSRNFDLLFHANWQCERKYRALADDGIDPNSSAMHLDDSLGDCEPKPCATLLAAGDRVAGLLELLKQLGLISCRNAWARVMNGDAERAVCGSDLNGHFPSIGELNRITHEVKQDLRQPALVTARWRQVGRHFDVES